MSKRTLFSVIIPTFNRSDRLKIAMESLVSQTCRDFEVIVCDDGSTDGSREVAESFSEKFPLKYIWSENWGGPAKPRNTGLEHAEGEWVCFLDSDDFWYPEKLACCNEVLDKSDFIYHNFHVFSSVSGQRTGFKICREVSRDDAFTDLLLNWNGIVNSGVAVRRSVINKAGPFFEDKSFVLDEDFEMWLRIAKQTNRFTYIRKILGGYYLSETNISKDIDKSLERELFLLERNRQYLSAEQFQRVKGILGISCGLRHLENGDSKSAKLYFRELLSKGNPISNKARALLYLILGRRSLLLTRLYTYVRMAGQDNVL
jgi:glycosyltransferase involved in cell wall biosynthesis